MIVGIFLKLQHKINTIREALVSHHPSKFGFLLVTKIFLLEVSFSIFKYLLILFKKPSLSFKILVNQPALEDCFYSYVEHKNFQKKLRVFSMAGFTTVIAATIISTLVLNLTTGPIFQSRAATYSWTQTSWAGGATSNNATHASNQTGWNQYSAADSNLAAVNSGADLQVSSQSNTWTVTNDGTTDTGFNNAGVVMSQTAVSGSGSGAGIVLTQSATDQEVSVGFTHVCALKSDGTAAYCWGDNTYGQLGDNTTTLRNRPVQVLGVGGSGTLTGVSQIVAGFRSSCALKTDGTVYCWGDNTYGQLGDNTTTQRNTPVQVLGVGGSGNLTGVSQISGGYFHSCAVKTDGTAYCWGYNAYGQLGDNTTTQRNTPVQVLGVGGSGNLTGVSQVSVGYDSTCAVKTDGTAYCWGRNAYGQLGDNTTTQRNTPVQVLGVGGSGNLTEVSQISAGGDSVLANGGYSQTCAVKTDGTAYCWGDNTYGQLGDNTTTVRHTPVQVLGVGGVGNLTGVSQISTGYFHSCAVKTDGTAYCWGYNGNGQLGDNTTTARYTPTQILGVEGSGNLTEVFQISAGYYSACAVKTDGTAYCWGYNGNGQLGIGTSTGSNTPVQVYGVISGFLNLNVTVYFTSGTFTSHIYNTTGDLTYGNLSWTATTPSGTSVTIKARSGNQSNLSDATAWSSCTNITSGQALSTGGCVTNGHQYIQFQATLSTTDIHLSLQNRTNSN